MGFQDLRDCFVVNETDDECKDEYNHGNVLTVCPSKQSRGYNRKPSDNQDL